jgi:chaperone required for assembly of F1-ATPase
MKPKRWFEKADVIEAEGGYTVVLDERPVRSPGGKALILPTRELARLIADEWQAQDGEIQPHTMPVMVLAATAIDHMAPRRNDAVKEAIRYAGTDLLCYRAEFPEDLAQRQVEVWQPLLDWAAETLGARLRVTEGITPVEQPTQALEALRAVVDTMDDLQLTALSSATAAAGSLILGLALALGKIDADQAFEMSCLDERFQMDRWGEDREALDRHQRLRDDLRTAAHVLVLCRNSHSDEARSVDQGEFL